MLLNASVRAHLRWTLQFIWREFSRALKMLNDAKRFSKGTPKMDMCFLFVNPLVDCFQWLAHKLNVGHGMYIHWSGTSVVCLASEERGKTGNLRSQRSNVASVVMWSLCGIAIGSYVCECVSV